MALTREDLTAAVHRRSPHITQQKARMIVDAVIDEIASALLESATLKIHGFGVFAVHARRARPGRNMHSGEPCEISARRALTFRPSTRLIEAVNARAGKKVET